MWAVNIPYTFLHLRRVKAYDMRQNVRDTVKIKARTLWHISNSDAVRFTQKSADFMYEENS